jgi:hypothetical protein
MDSSRDFISMPGPISALVIPCLIHNRKPVQATILNPVPRTMETGFLEAVEDVMMELPTDMHASLHKKSTLQVAESGANY